MTALFFSKALNLLEHVVMFEKLLNCSTQIVQVSKRVLLKQTCQPDGIGRNVKLVLEAAKEYEEYGEVSIVTRLLAVVKSGAKHHVKCLH